MQLGIHYYTKLVHLFSIFLMSGYQAILFCLTTQSQVLLMCSYVCPLPEKVCKSLIKSA